jgi:hypothetical protein
MTMKSQPRYEELDLSRIFPALAVSEGQVIAGAKLRPLTYISVL